MPDPSSESPPVLLVEDRGAVRILRMNRPDKLNALNTALTQALLDAFAAAEGEEGVRAVVLAGEGRAFCAGADLSEFKDLTPGNADLVSERAELTCRTQIAAQSMTKPVIAAARGATVGGGAGLAIGSDMVVAASDLKFGYPEVNHGIVPALVMTGLQRALGRKAAFEMISLGRLIGAEEALALGLVNRVVEPDGLLAAALEIANRWAEASPAALGATKSLFYRVADLATPEAMAAGKEMNMAMRAFRRPS